MSDDGWNHSDTETKDDDGDMERVDVDEDYHETSRFSDCVSLQVYITIFRNSVPAPFASLSIRTIKPSSSNVPRSRETQYLTRITSML